MASTITIRNSINFIRPILKNEVLEITVSEPALEGGNMILETMLAAPLRWRFNRAFASFTTIKGVTDYPLALPNFGYLETQWITDGNGKVFQFDGEVSLPKVGDMSRPTQIAAQYDDNAGNLVFRVKGCPDAAYSVGMDYQMKAQRITSIASRWGNVPDEFSMCFNLGFLSFMSLLVNDSRFPIFDQMFLSRVLSLQDGLNDQQRDIFVGNWIARNNTLARSSGSVQQAVAVRTR